MAKFVKMAKSPWAWGEIHFCTLAKEALAAEKAEIAMKREQLTKQEAKIREWIKNHPDVAELLVDDS